MVDYASPTILASRSVSAILPAAGHGNLAWNSDGQCLFIAKRGVHIYTPYLTSTLPAPHKLIDPAMNLEYSTSIVNRAKRKALAAEEDMDVDDADEPGPSSRAKMRRPVGGEVKWWTSGIAIDEDATREKLYGWNEIGNEYSTVYHEREVHVISAIWSPSGLSDGGGSLSARMVSSGQVSIFAPRSDPASKQWDEEGMGWSDRIPQLVAPRDTGSLLLLADRAGHIALWSYGCTRRFRRAVFKEVVKSGWIISSTWSSWEQVSETDYQAKVALVSSSGSVSVMIVTQSRGQDGRDTAWDTTCSDTETSDQGDRRAITAIVWIDDLLVWSKPGSVHLSNQSTDGRCTWKGTRDLRLQRFGNWASANALSACVGIARFGSNGLLITLSSLSYHIITDLQSSPRWAPVVQSLRLSVVARECMLDFVYAEAGRRDRIQTIPKNAKDISAHTCGHAAIDADGQVISWALEVINFHNMDGIADANRVVNFAMIDVSGVLGGDISVVQRLEKFLTDPPRVLSTAPTRSLLPFLMQISASADPESYAQDILELCSTHVSAIERYDPTGGSSSSDRRLLEAFWADAALDILRLRLVLARWGVASLTKLRSDFVAAAHALTTEIRIRVARAIVRCTADWVKENTPSSGNVAEHWVSTTTTGDRAFLRLLKDTSDQPGEGEIISQPLQALDGIDDQSPPEEVCPACGSKIITGELGSAICTQGHEWARCSVTNLLVTTADYRVCNTCPAISLLPHQLVQPPIAVTVHGGDQDHQRFAAVGKGDLVDRMLDAAVVCVVCGGRWVRAM